MHVSSVGEFQFQWASAVHVLSVGEFQGNGRQQCVFRQWEFQGNGRQQCMFHQWESFKARQWTSPSSTVVRMPNLDEATYSADTETESAHLEFVIN